MPLVSGEQAAETAKKARPNPDEVLNFGDVFIPNQFPGIRLRLISGVSRHAGLYQPAKHVYAELLDSGFTSGKCHPFIRTIAKRVHISEEHTRRCLRQLRKRQFIRAKRRFNYETGRTSNEYFFLWHEAFAQDRKPVAVESKPRKRPGTEAETDRARMPGCPPSTDRAHMHLRPGDEGCRDARTDRAQMPGALYEDPVLSYPRAQSVPSSSSGERFNSSSSGGGTSTQEAPCGAEASGQSDPSSLAALASELRAMREQMAQLAAENAELRRQLEAKPQNQNLPGMGKAQFDDQRHGCRPEAERVFRGETSELIALHEEWTGDSPDRNLVEQIELLLAGRGVSLKTFLTDIAPRLPRLTEKPGSGFFLWHARNWPRNTQMVSAPTSPSAAAPPRPVCPECGCTPGRGMIARGMEILPCPTCATAPPPARCPECGAIAGAGMVIAPDGKHLVDCPACADARQLAAAGVEA